MKPDGTPHRQYRLQRDDGLEDATSQRRFSSYDEAYDALERICSDYCCSDDRIDYTITPAD